jgi:hypothetical protein
MGDAFIISGLREKRSSVAGRTVELRCEADRLEADLFHIDAVLRLYDVDPGEIPTKGRVPSRSPNFNRKEVTRRIYDALRLHGTVASAEIAHQAMLDNGLGAVGNRKLRTLFAHRFLTSFHDLLRTGRVERSGTGGGVRWRLADRAANE